MKINIYDNNEKLAYNPNTMKSLGVGETQRIIIYLSKELKKQGHDVTVYVKCNTPNIYDGIGWYQYYDYKPNNEDLLIGFESLPSNYNAKKVINFSTRVAVNDVDKYPEVDKLIVLSAWHRDRYASELPAKLVDKMEVVNPGVDEKYFLDKEKWKNSISYIGHPYKGGMKALVKFAKKLKSDLNVPIHAYGTGKWWGWNNEHFRPLYDKMIKKKILFHGQGGENKIVKHLNGTEIFIYPVAKHYQEVFGLPVLEAMATGCVVIASANGNLKNLIKDVGYSISGNVENYKWHLEAIKIIKELLNNPDLRKELSKDSIKKARKYTWKKTVKNLMNKI